MSGGNTQLVAIGAQDIYLTGKPQVSFFQSTYKRHANFCRVTHKQSFQGGINPLSMTSMKVEHKGDLLNYMYLTKKNPNGTPTNFTNSDEIRYIELLIGGQIIDSQDNEFMITVADPYLCSTQQKTDLDGNNSSFYPFRFWFCENWASALPLIALQYHDVEIRIHWGTATNYIYEAWGDFTYLDNAERAMFSQPHKVLMYQTQKQAIAMGSTNQNLVFNQPVKFLATNYSLPLLQSTATSSLVLQLNGVDIGEQKKYIPHFTTVPIYYTYPWEFTSSIGFLLPFCLDISKIQPSGQLNFSRLDSARLVTDGTFQNLYSNRFIYAVSYNVLQFENGMAGLLYAN